MSARGTRGWARNVGSGLSSACGFFRTRGRAFRLRTVAAEERFVWTGRGRRLESASRHARERGPFRPLWALESVARARECSLRCSAEAAR